MAINFEEIHKEFDGMIFELCNECGGLCERNVTVSLLPNEAEFIASKINMNFQDFIKKFCSIIKYKNHYIYIYISKVGLGPCLDENNRCVLERFNCKILRCLVYPVLIGLKNNKPIVFLDYKGCPMAKRVGKVFLDKAFKVSKQILKEVPKWWLEYVSKFDECYYDYKKLEKFRDRDIILAKELEKCKVK